MYMLPPRYTQRHEKVNNVLGRSKYFRVYKRHLYTTLHSKTKFLFYSSINAYPYTQYSAYMHV